MKLSKIDTKSPFLGGVGLGSSLVVSSFSVICHNFQFVNFTKSTLYCTARIYWSTSNSQIVSYRLYRLLYCPYELLSTISLRSFRKEGISLHLRQRDWLPSSPTGFCLTSLTSYQGPCSRAEVAVLSLVRSPTLPLSRSEAFLLPDRRITS